MKDKYEGEKVNREDRVTGGGKEKKERRRKKRGIRSLWSGERSFERRPLLSAANNDLAPLSAEPSSHSPVHEKASRVRRGGDSTLLEFVRFIYHQIFSAMEPRWRKLGGRGRTKGETGLDEKLYCIYCEMKFLRGDYSRCVLRPTEQPSITEFRSYQNVSGVVDTRQERATLLFHSIFFLSVEHVRPFVSLFLALFLSLGYRMAIVEIFIVHGRGEEGDRLTVRAGSSFLTNWSAGNCPSPGATCRDPG